MNMRISMEQQHKNSPGNRVHKMIQTFYPDGKPVAMPVPVAVGIDPDDLVFGENSDPAHPEFSQDCLDP